MARFLLPLLSIFAVFLLLPGSRGLPLSRSRKNTNRSHLTGYRTDSRFPRVAGEHPNPRDATMASTDTELNKHDKRSLNEKPLEPLSLVAGEDGSLALEITREGLVRGTTSHDSPFASITLSRYSDCIDGGGLTPMTGDKDKDVQLRIYGNESGRYVCVNKSGQIYSTGEPTCEDCSWVQRPTSNDANKDWYYSRYHRGKPRWSAGEDDDDEDDSDTFSERRPYESEAERKRRKRRNRKWFLSLDSNGSPVIAYRAKRNNPGSLFMDRKIDNQSTHNEWTTTAKPPLYGIFRPQASRPGSQSSQHRPRHHRNCDPNDPLVRFRVGCQRVLSSQRSSSLSNSDRKNSQRTPSSQGGFHFFTPQRSRITGGGLFRRRGRTDASHRRRHGNHQRSRNGGPTRRH